MLELVINAEVKSCDLQVIVIPPFVENSLYEVWHKWTSSLFFELSINLWSEFDPFHDSSLSLVHLWASTKEVDVATVTIYRDFWGQSLSSEITISGQQGGALQSRGMMGKLILGLIWSNGKQHIWNIGQFSKCNVLTTTTVKHSKEKQKLSKKGLHFGWHHLVFGDWLHICPRRSSRGVKLTKLMLLVFRKHQKTTFLSYILLYIMMFKFDIRVSKSCRLEVFRDKVIL